MSYDLVLFSRAMCAGCNYIKPDLSLLSQTHGFDYEIIELSSETLEIFQKYDIRTAPTLVLMESGSIVQKFPGYYGRKILEDRLREWGVIHVGS